MRLETSILINVSPACKAGMLSFFEKEPYEPYEMPDMGVNEIIDYFYGTQLMDSAYNAGRYDSNQNNPCKYSMEEYHDSSIQALAEMAYLRGYI